MNKYIMIDKNNNSRDVIVIETSDTRYNIPAILFAQTVGDEISEIDRDNKKCKNRQLKTDLNSIKQLVEEGYCVLAEAGDFVYSISLRNPDGDKRPSVTFSTAKENGMATLFDKTEEWAEAVIDDYGVQI